MSKAQRDLFVFGLAIGLAVGLVLGAGMKALERKHQAHFEPGAGGLVKPPAELVQPGTAELNPE